MRAHVLALALALVSAPAFAEGEGEGKKKTNASGSWVASDSTNIDFSETAIDGKMQAPAGFFLQGKQSQSLSQMVKLRNKFRSELRNSKAAVKSLVK